MENRAHPRHEAGVEARVEHRWLGHIRARIRDVNANGMFVEFPPNTDLNPMVASLSRSPITVRYRLPRGPAGRRYVWRGHVARIGQSGVGATIADARVSGDPNLSRLVEYARRLEAQRREAERGSDSQSP